MADKFDVVVVGGGPGGYVAAIRAAQLDLSVALIEKRKGLGGTCLNVGCIPSKALLDSSELYHAAKHKFSKHGIGTGELTLDFEKMMARKSKVVSDTVAGIDYLVKKNKITRYVGTGTFADPYTIAVSGEQEAQVEGKYIILATGSEPTPLPFAPFDGKRIISSTEALGLDQVPEHLLVIGAGVIGLELGSVYARLGSKVTVIEFLDAVLPSMDRELGKALQRSLKTGLKFDFHLKTKVTGITANKDSVTVTAENNKGEQSFEGDYALVAIGRRAYTEGLNLTGINLKTEANGKLKVNDRLQTPYPHIFAIGDIVDGPMLAHKAEEEGVAAAELIAGQISHVNYDVIPGVVYTWPEVASVGKTEEELKDREIPYRKGMFPFKASGRARAADETEGFIKVLSHELTDEIVGVHMMGARCAEIISEAVVAMEYAASAEDIARIVHAHPTFTEPLKEAAMMAWSGKAIHL